METGNQAKGEHLASEAQKFWAAMTAPGATVELRVWPSQNKTGQGEEEKLPLPSLFEHLPSVRI